MPLNFVMSLMTGAEFMLWAVLGFFFWKKGFHRRFPAMSTYLALRIASMPVLLGLLYVQAQSWGHNYFPLYFFGYWAVFIASAIVLFLVTLEIFRSVLSSFTGLMRLGTIAFRWVAVISAVVSLTSVSFKHPGFAMIPDIAVGLMRSVSILELCMLAFLCLCMNTLHLSVRDVSFGLALGLGMMSANDFIVAAMIPASPSLNAPLQFAYEFFILTSLGVWVAYCALPEPARKPLVMPVNSTIYRWNEIAAALGHGTQVAVQQPAGSFFLTDVEKVVDKVLTRNLQNSVSKS